MKKRPGTRRSLRLLIFRPDRTGGPPRAGGGPPRRLAAPCAAALAAAGLLVLAAWAAAAAPGDPLRRATAGLDPERVPGGILYDRVVPMAGLAELDGGPDAPPAGTARWRQALHELTLASLAPPTWPDAGAMRDEARAARAAGRVHVGVLDFRYGRIREDAVESGLLVWEGGRLVEGEGVAGGEPYRAARAFAAAAQPAATCQGEAVEFVLARRHYLTNDDAPVRLVEMDLADGAGWRAVRFDVPVGARFASAGDKLLRLRVTRADGSVRHARFPFVVRALRTPAPDETWALTAAIPYQSGYGTGDAFVYLADGHAALVDPVVVVEGFDIENTMGWEELYLLLNQEALLETLLAEGFDAVILDFTDSTDYIQRNAYLLVELIEQVQAAVSGDRDLLVIGASMGGLVARHALAYMESEGIDHRMRSFISFDAPQAGANIPLGLQYWLDLFSIESADAAYLLARLDTPAARQMLLYHHTVPPGTTGESDPLLAGLMGELAALGGYPADLRRVAVANGSGAGQDQGFAAGDQIILYEYESFLVDIVGNVWAVPDGGPHIILDGLIDRIWPLDDDELTVTVAGTRPWDSAPGGHRGSMAQMDSTSAPYGDIIALHDDHCFIPTISALDLAVADPFFDITGEPDILALTPFDAVYYPQANQEHVTVTAESREWFLDEIRRDGTAAPAGPAPAAAIALAANHPNPFNPATTLPFHLPREGRARLRVFDAAGRPVAVLADGAFVAGWHRAEWRGRDEAGRELPTGVYLARLEAAGEVRTRKLLMLR
ncbi:MAG: hypothetical protein JW819_02815 [Candidatus Krumholzibacteriota bacterium]|nr:hypothetical protein [Candidatus Krumholzibacteriota bacterium]